MKEAETPRPSYHNETLTVSTWGRDPDSYNVRAFGYLILEGITLEQMRHLGESLSDASNALGDWGASEERRTE